MSRAAMALMATAVLLAAVVLLELLTPLGPREENAAGPAMRATATAGPGQTGMTDFTQTILGRPLFRGDRRPAPGDGRGVASGPSDLPRLTGILLTPDEKRAIFQPAGKERPIVVVEGETVGNWRVEQIAVDAVTLTGPGGTRRIEPKFLTGAQPSAPPQPPVPAIGRPGGQPNGGMDRPQGKR